MAWSKTVPCGPGVPFGYEHERHAVAAGLVGAMNNRTKRAHEYPRGHLQSTEVFAGRDRVVGRKLVDSVGGVRLRQDPQASVEARTNGPRIPPSTFRPPSRAPSLREWKPRTSDSTTTAGPRRRRGTPFLPPENTHAAHRPGPPARWTALVCKVCVTTRPPAQDGDDDETRGRSTPRAR